MSELLKVLAEWLSFFFIRGRYRLVNSDVGSSFGDALIDLASESLQWRLVRDRSQIFLDCRPVRRSGESDDWFSADLLIRLLTGRRVESAELTEGMATWFKRNISEIEERLSGDRLENTVSELKRLKRLRAKELFG